MIRPMLFEKQSLLQDNNRSDGSPLIILLQSERRFASD
jgi:hypothetical protein